MATVEYQRSSADWWLICQTCGGELVRSPLPTDPYLWLRSASSHGCLSDYYSDADRAWHLSLGEYTP